MRRTEHVDPASWKLRILRHTANQCKVPSVAVSRCGAGLWRTMPTIMNDKLLLSIDGGETSTKAMIASVDGAIVGSGVGSPTVHYLSEGGPEKRTAKRLLRDLQNE